MKETTKRDKIIAAIIWIGSAITLAMTLASCSSVKHFRGNPDPSMKTVHMSTVHWNYTPEQYESHPDHDCNGSINYGS